MTYQFSKYEPQPPKQPRPDKMLVGQVVSRKIKNKATKYSLYRAMKDGIALGMAFSVVEADGEYIVRRDK